MRATSFLSSLIPFIQSCRTMMKELFRFNFFSDFNHALLFANLTLISWGVRFFLHKIFVHIQNFYNFFHFSVYLTFSSILFALTYSHYNFVTFQWGDRFLTSESDVHRRQIMTSKNGPRAETVTGYCVITLNSYNSEILLYKPWRSNGIFQFEIIINALVSYFPSNLIPMLWDYDHYK